MTNLQQLQQNFQNYILDNQPAICAEIVETAALNAEIRLGIYSNAYATRLIEVLELDFAGLHTLLGDQGFHELCHVYLRAHPSRYRSVRWFASHLVNFLRTTEPYSQHPLLAEMAAFEWSFQHVLDAANAEKVTVDDVAKIVAEQWPQMHFKFHPAVQRLDFQWNVVQIWQAVEAEQEPPEPIAAEWPVPWVLWRGPELQVFFASLPIEAAWALDTLMKGHSFAQLCAGLCEWMDEEHAGPHAAALLKNWLEQGMIVECIIL